MSGLLRGAGSVLLAVALAFAWLWTNLLKDIGWMNDTARVVVLAVLTVIFVAQQTYLAMPKPVGLAILDARRDVIGLALETLWNRYYKEALPDLGVAEPHPTVRINVMVLTKKWKGLGGTYLKIYWHHPAGVLYSADELALRWKQLRGVFGFRKPNGVVGRAWKNRHQAVYDSKDVRFKSANEGLTQSQKKATANRKSALSVPIRYGDDFVAMLNMDSIENVPRTKFADPEVVTLALQAAKILKGQFDPKGLAE